MNPLQDNIGLLCFSGTGNSRLAMKWSAEAITGAGLGTTEFHVSNLSSAELDGCVGLCVFGPVHGFTLPLPLVKALLGLPQGNGRPAAVVITRGAVTTSRGFFPGLEGTAAALAAMILSFRGYRVISTLGLDMPSNWCMASPQMEADKADKLMRVARRKLIPALEPFMEAAKGSPSEEQWNFTGAVKTDFALQTGLLLFPLSLFYITLGRMGLASTFFANEKCTGCGFCARTCPQQAIKIRGRKFKRPRWTWKCVSCMKCIASCPAGAIDASHLPLAAIILIQYGLYRRFRSGSSLFRLFLLWPLFHSLWSLIFMDPHIARFLTTFGCGRLLGKPVIQKEFSRTSFNLGN